MKRLRAMLNGSIKMDAIGVVLDAVAPNLLGKWNSIRCILIPLGYKCLSLPNANGTILNLEGVSNIGIWMMPDNTVDGMLEDFCARLISEQAINYASECAQNALQRGLATYKSNHSTKAAIHTALAWQDSPGMPLGQAITARALDAASPIAEVFANFLRTTFTP